MSTLGSTTPASNTHKVITIHLHANYEIKTVRKTKKSVATNGQSIRKDFVQHFVTFRVHKEKFAALPSATEKFTNVLTTMLHFNQANSRYQSQSDLTHGFHDDPRGWDLMLHIFACGEVPARLLKVPASDLWHLAVVLDKWNIDHKDERVQGFYAAWYKEAAKAHENVDTMTRVNFMRTLLWPSWYFDHAEAYMISTKYLVYHDVGHVEPRNPTKYKGIIMPKRIISKFLRHIARAVLTTQAGALNTAKSKVRKDLHSKLYKIIEADIKQDHCEHAEKIVYSFMMELQRLKASFLDLDNTYISTIDLLNRLKDFTWNPKQTCRLCHGLNNVDNSVRKAVLEVRNYIDGQCLDDINKENAFKHNVKDCPYGDWMDHRDTCGRDNWSVGCRQKHGQPTWYYSSSASDFHKNRLFQNHQEVSDEEVDESEAEEGAAEDE